MPGRTVTFAPRNAPASTTTGAAAAGKNGLQRMVAIADVRVGEDEHALGEGHLALERHTLGEVEEALVSDEALVPDLEARRALVGTG